MISFPTLIPIAKEEECGLNTLFLLGHDAHACVEDYACGSKRGRKAKGDDPAINDPTTAVQALDQIEDVLRRLG